MSKCRHDWSQDHDGDWWTCSYCPTRMHPTWTPDSRARFEIACELLLLEMTALDEIIDKLT